MIESKEEGVEPPRDDGVHEHLGISGPLEELCRLFSRTGKTGKPYYGGKSMSGQKFFMFPVTRAREGGPEFTLMMSKSEQDKLIELAGLYWRTDNEKAIHYSGLGKDGRRYYVYSVINKRDGGPDLRVLRTKEPERRAS